MFGSLRKRFHLGLRFNPLVMLSDEQISFLSTKDFFNLKKEVDAEVSSLLYTTQEFIRKIWDSKAQWYLPNEISKAPRKISKGHNYKGFPYQVFDYPSIFSEQGIFSFRIVIWYGNSFSINLILTDSFLEFFKPQIPKLKNKSVNLLTEENIWETDISNNTYLPIDDATFAAIIDYLEKNKSIRLFRQFSMNQINALDRLTVECFNDWFAQ